jgi:hypothetical protein
MSGICAANSLQGQFLKETGRDFFEWQRILLSIQHETQTAAIAFMQVQGLTKAKAEFLLLATASAINFPGENK